MWEYFSGAFSKSSVYKVYECLKGGCVSAQAVCLGHLSLTLRMLCRCVACTCICVFTCVGMAGHLCVFGYIPVCVFVPVSLGFFVSVPGESVLSVLQRHASL